MDSPNTLMIWKAHERFSIHDAALLMFGIAPEGENYNLLRFKPERDWPTNMLAVVKLLKDQLEKEAIQGELKRLHDINANIPDVDIEESIVEAASLRCFLKQKGIYDNFFNDEDEASASYLDKTNENYAPKLAAAVNAWLEVTSDYDNHKGSTPKQKIETWLRKNAVNYDLIRDDGKQNESAITNISAIANWRPEGGASKTPTKKTVKKEDLEGTAKKKFVLPKVDLSIKKSKLTHPTKSEGIPDDSDDDIPF